MFPINFLANIPYTFQIGSLILNFQEKNIIFAHGIETVYFTPLDSGFFSDTLVTGASGFLGRCLREFLESDSGSNPSLFDLDHPVLPDSGIGNIFHLAAMVAYGIGDSKSLFESNVQLTEKLVSKYPDSRMVFASSVSVYGQQPGDLNETSLPGNSAPYGLSKLWAEQWVSSLNDYAILRFPSLYGPGMNPNTIIPRFFSQAMNKGIIEVWGDGSRHQFYLHASDASALMTCLMDSGKKGVFLGMGEKSFSNLELAEMIARITGAEIKHVGEDNSHSMKFNNSHTRKELGWSPAIELEEGLHQYFTWKKGQLS